jgi:serine/threonine protein kinase
MMVADRFQIIRLLGAGGQAEVWQAYDLVRQELVALKKVRTDVLENAQALARFFREITILQSVQHESIVRIYDVFSSQGFYSMEYLDGENLRMLLKKEDEPLPLRDVLPWIKSLADALQHLHQKGLIHRDLKPENLILLKDSQKLKLLDFGIAIMADATRYTSAQGIVGTPFYMAPEQITPTGNITPAADIFALGVVFFELLTRSLPQGYVAPMEELRPELPVETAKKLDQLLKEMMKHRPEQRIAWASFFRALEELRSLTTQQTNPPLQQNTLRSMAQEALPPLSSALSSLFENIRVGLASVQKSEPKHMPPSDPQHREESLPTTKVQPLLPSNSLGVPRPIPNETPQQIRPLLARVPLEDNETIQFAVNAVDPSFKASLAFSGSVVFLIAVFLFFVSVGVEILFAITFLSVIFFYAHFCEKVFVLTNKCVHTVEHKPWLMASCSSVRLDGIESVVRKDPHLLLVLKEKNLLWMNKKVTLEQVHEIARFQSEIERLLKKSDS